MVVGLEVHAELNTASKIYCNCRNAFGLEVNTQVCPVCMGMPGTLPTLNEKVVEYAIKMGHAMNCKINAVSKQDRKNYFYPDLPKAYQISQSEMFRYCKMDLMVSRYAFASALLRISGSETISISGTPQRFRSTREPEKDASCSSFPASSSMWILVTPIRFSSPSTIISKYPFSQSGTSACEIWYAFGRSG
jgi:hypothetical protein